MPFVTNLHQFAAGPASGERGMGQSARLGIEADHRSVQIVERDEDDQTDREPPPRDLGRGPGRPAGHEGEKGYRRRRRLEPLPDLIAGCAALGIDMGHPAERKEREASEEDDRRGIAIDDQIADAP